MVAARLHTGSLVDTAMPSLSGHHIMLQLWIAEHDLAGLVVVVACARPCTATSTATSTIPTCKTSVRGVSCMALPLGLSQLHWSGVLVPHGSPTWSLTHCTTKVLSDQCSSCKIHRLLHQHLAPNLQRQPTQEPIQ